MFHDHPKLLNQKSRGLTSAEFPSTNSHTTFQQRAGGSQATERNHEPPQKYETNSLSFDLAFLYTTSDDYAWQDIVYLISAGHEPFEECSMQKCKNVQCICVPPLCGATKNTTREISVTSPPKRTVHAQVPVLLSTQ